MSGLRILAIDPSSTTLGWCILEEDNLVGYGLISTSKVAYDHRFMHISGELGKLLRPQLTVWVEGAHLPGEIELSERATGIRLLE